MAKFTIPKDDWKALVSLFLLKPEDKNGFLEVIQNPANVTHADDFAKYFVTTTKIDRKEANKIIRILFKIYNLYDSSGEDIDSNISILMDAINEIDKKEIKEASAEDLELFGSFLRKILSLHDTLGVRAKAYRLIPQHQHIFLRSELYSDIRPVFRPDKPEIQPSAAVIIHSLKIVYHEDYETKDFFLGLSDNDLRQLMKTIERAIKKQECLKTMIGNLGIQCLEEED